jgi:hypothetical protein
MRCIVVLLGVVVTLKLVVELVVALASGGCMHGVAQLNYAKDTVLLALTRLHRYLRP